MNKTTNSDDLKDFLDSDKSYLNGLKLGFTLGVADDFAGYRKIVENYQKEITDAKKELEVCAFPEVCPEHATSFYAKEIDLKTAPIGTLAPAIMGGAWVKTDHGWKCNNTGGTFPRPGGDWNGKLIYKDT
jgi:hypothetical protein